VEYDARPAHPYCQGECDTSPMYIPKHFEVSEWSEITNFVARARAADLVTVDSGGLPQATRMPCLWKEDGAGETQYGSLVMHMARANQQWKSIGAGTSGLAIVHGPQAYISPSNYESKVTDHKVVPTWNYQSVHLSGTVEISEDVELLRKIVSDLTDFHESERVERWSTTDADPQYIQAQLHGIIAVILRVSRVEAKYKLSQNRSLEDQNRVFADLESSDLPEEREIASEMKRNMEGFLG
jgi:transcriptional regulator